MAQLDEFHRSWQGNQGNEAMGSPTPRARRRRRDFLMPTRHKMNPNWSYRGDNTKYKEKK